MSAYVGFHNFPRTFGRDMCQCLDGDIEKKFQTSFMGLGQNKKVLAY